MGTALVLRRQWCGEQSCSRGGADLRFVRAVGLDFSEQVAEVHRLALGGMHNEMGWRSSASMLVGRKRPCQEQGNVLYRYRYLDSGVGRKGDFRGIWEN